MPAAVGDREKVQREAATHDLEWVEADPARELAETR